MVRRQRRLSPRCDCSAEIMMAGHWEGDFLDAQLGNTSREGMLIISRRPLVQGAGIYIRADQAFYRHYSPLYRSFFGKIRWCQPDRSLGGYSLGMQLMIKSPGYFDWDVYPGINQCDKCGSRVSSDELKKEEGLFLCQRCYELVTRHAKGSSVRDGMENFLLGNVL